MSVFHVELRRFPYRAHAFNLSEHRLLEEIIGPWRRGEPVEFAERTWDPSEAKLTVLEGELLETSDLGMGRGWSVASRHGANVTERELAAPAAADGVEERLLARCTSAGRPQPVVLAWELAETDERAATASERLALAERAVRTLLNGGALELWADGRRALRPEAIDAVLRTRVTWTAGSGAAELRLARSGDSGPGAGT